MGNWEDELSPYAKGLLSNCDTGPVRDFPHYPTIFPNGAPKIVELTNAEVNLLYQLQAWNVSQNPEAFSFMSQK